MPIVLELPPGRYAPEVSVWLEGARDTHNGFYLRVTRPGAGTPAATAATAPALGGTPSAAAPRVLTTTAASPCLSTP